MIILYLLLDDFQEVRMILQVPQAVSTNAFLGGSAARLLHVCISEERNLLNKGIDRVRTCEYDEHRNQILNDT